jgi:hypothetical protein
MPIEKREEIHREDIPEKTYQKRHTRGDIPE